MKGMFKKVCGEYGPVDIGGGLVSVDIKESLDGAHYEIVACQPGDRVEYLGGSSNRAAVEQALSRLQAFLSDPERDELDERDLWR